MPDEPKDFNAAIIQEFRANAGVVKGPFDGATLLLLHHHGRTSGTERVTPLAYQAVGDELAIFGSKAGAPEAPDWYLNLRAHPETKVEVGPETVNVRAREVTGSQRDEIFERQKQIMEGFAEYEKKTKGIRTIPVILLERV